MHVNFVADIVDQGELFHGVRITTENFEEIYVKKDYISSIYVKTSSLTGSDCEDVEVVFNKKFVDENATFLKRISDIYDITYIDILRNRDKSIEIEVPYIEDRNGLNSCQSIEYLTVNNDIGGVVLRISKKGGLLQ